MLKRIGVFILNSFLMLSLHAQLFDDFSDGNFTSNPEWIGNTGSFIVNVNKQLQLDTAGSGLKYLSTSSTYAVNTEWEFWVRLGFSPSDNNNLRIYLISNQADITGTLNGYYIKIGENLANDAIELFRQDGLVEKKIGRGIDGNVAVNPIVRIRVIRDSIGNWEVFSDLKGGTRFSSEFSTFDSTYSVSSYFGFLCKFTSSNAKAFFFDDVYAGPVRIDTLPPEIVFTEVLDQTKIRISFNEDIDTLSLYGSYFRLMPSGDTASIITVVEENILILDFAPKLFERNSWNRLTTQYISDLHGNILLQAQTIDFVYEDVGYKDIVINEFMADPSPPLDLPEKEYVELYNKLHIPINLNNWILADAAGPSTIGNVVIPARDYLILCNTADTAWFNSYGKVFGFRLPVLNNAADAIVLKHSNGRIIDSLYYADSWYRDDEKKNGGWALELINPNFNCKLDADNWIASNDPVGGTPGKANSVIDTSADNNGPYIKQFQIIEDNKLFLLFNEKLNDDDLPLISDVSLENISKKSDQYQTLSIDVDPPLFNTASLVFNKNFMINSVYRLEISDVRDCQPHHVSSNIKYEFIIPAKVDSFDMVVNEVLFNPYPFGFDFVELYNRSDKLIDLSSLKIANLDDNLQLNHVYRISDTMIILKPYDYIVLTQDPDDIQNRYHVKFPAKMLRMKNLPSYNNDKGNVLVLDMDNNVVDHFSYNNKMHFKLLDDEKGVSLERVNPDQPTNHASNWKSAASSYGYATPTYENSQYSAIDIDENEIRIEPVVFSPDNDGHDDYLKIIYSFKDNDNFGTIRIYDLNGRMVRRLVLNDLFGMEGFYVWDGTDDKGGRLNVGVYIIVVEIVNIDGTVSKYKRSCTLARNR